MTYTHRCQTCGATWTSNQILDLPECRRCRTPTTGDVLRYQARYPEDTEIDPGKLLAMLAEEERR